MNVHTLTIRQQLQEITRVNLLHILLIYFSTANKSIDANIGKGIFLSIMILHFSFANNQQLPTNWKLRIFQLLIKSINNISIIIS